MAGPVVHKHSEERLGTCCWRLSLRTTVHGRSGGWLVYHGVIVLIFNLVLINHEYVNDGSTIDDDSGVMELFATQHRQQAVQCMNIILIAT